MPFPLPDDFLLTKGARYRVLKPGARLTGWKPIAPWTQAGASVALEPGDVLEYLGMQYSGGSDGIDVHAFRLVSREHENVPYCTDFSPKHPDRKTIFDTRPDPTFLAPDRT